MSTSNDRFYLLEFKNRPVFHGDVGSILKMEGLVMGGGGASIVLLLPSSSSKLALEDALVHRMTVEECSDLLQRADQPELLMPDKAFHRKARYEISGAVQQKIWVADGFKCIYCGKKMGEVQLTIDHFMPLELGGKNDHTNYLSACKKCNKRKGSIHPKDFCGEEKAFELINYLAKRKV